MFTVQNPRDRPFPLAEADEVLLVAINHICKRYRLDLMVLPRFTVILGDRKWRLKWPDKNGDGAELEMVAWNARGFRRACIMFCLNQLLQAPNVEVLAREIERS